MSSTRKTKAASRSFGEAEQAFEMALEKGIVGHDSIERVRATIREDSRNLVRELRRMGRPVPPALQKLS